MPMITPDKSRILALAGMIILVVSRLLLASEIEYYSSTQNPPLPPGTGEYHFASENYPVSTQYANPAITSTNASTSEAEIWAQRWLRHPVAFESDKRPLAEVLGEFASRQGFAAKISPALVGTVSGNFSFSNPAEFLDILCRTKQMNWYFDGGTVHFFSNAELETRLLPLRDKSEETLRWTLRELGLYDPRFEWRTADGGRLLMIQGPAVYLTRIAEVLESMREVEKAEVAKVEELKKAEEVKKAAQPREKTLGVFRLKHAWAAEKAIATGDSTTLVPGVADILRQILSQSPLPPQGERSVTAVGYGAPRLIKGTGIVARANLPAEPEEVEADGVPFIQADSRINAVLVWDYPENLERYRGIVNALDHPLDLVEIRAAIIDIETDSTKELGFAWEYRGNNPNWQNDATINVTEGTRPYIPVVGEGFQYATIYKHGLDNFMARISAMEKKGNANILSRPSVLTQDNIQATLEHTDTFYVRLQGRDEVDLADIKTGLTLKVTPHVIQDDANIDAYGEYCGPEKIQLAVFIADGTNTADTDIGQVDSLPRVKQSTITTQAVVSEGEALVIGGYYNETTTTSHSGVPGLSKIPGIGALFRKKSSIANRNERLFILSPRIVRSGDAMQVLPETKGDRAFNSSPGRDFMAAPAVEKKDFPAKKTGRRP